MPYFDFVNECILTPVATELMPLFPHSTFSVVCFSLVQPQFEAVFDDSTQHARMAIRAASRR